MQANRRRDSGPEIRIRNLLHAAGLRYRVDRRIGAGASACRPDIVFGPARVAVFIDGCFWHSCPVHGHVPQVNRDYWAPKLARTVERDKRQVAILGEMGWEVLRIWEHEDAASAADRIRHVVVGRRTALTIAPASARRGASGALPAA